jgi:hypothetical protein
MIRPKITAKLDSQFVRDFEDGRGLIHVVVEWQEVLEGEVLGEVKFREEWKTGGEMSYVSRVAVEDANVLPGTFCMDQAGRRHFHLRAEVGEIGLLGSPAGVGVNG